MPKSLIRTIFFSLLLLTLILVGCSGSTTNTTTSTSENENVVNSSNENAHPEEEKETAPVPEKSNLKVGIIPISNLTPIYVAQQLGYFAEVGLSVETSNASGGAELTSALIGGSLDFAYSNFVSVIQANAQDFNLQIVANQNSAQDTPPDAAALIVRNDGVISSVSELKGKTIGINALGNINQISAIYSLEKNGISPDQVKFVELPFPNMGDALLKGDIDAAIQVEPFITILKSSNSIAEIDYPFITLNPGLDIAGFISTADFNKDHPITVELFVEALAKANDYLNNNPAELVKYTAEFTKSEQSMIESIVLDKWGHIVNVENLQLLSDLSFKYGFQQKNLNVEDFIYNTAK